MNKKISFIKIALLVIVGFSITIIQPSVLASQTTYSTENLPEEARVWQDRNGVEGSGYSNFSGGNIAYVDEGWYYFEEGQWILFHQGEILNLGESDTNITETLQYEVMSGTAFAAEGPAGMYGMSLNGRTGDLITESGMNFNPQNHIKLKDSNGKQAAKFFYDTAANIWWSAHPDDWGKSVSPPTPPYKPLSIPSGSIPAPTQFGNDVVNQYLFDITTRLYMNNDGLSVAGFHSSVTSGFRYWSSANFNGWNGYDVAFNNNVWYSVEDETHYFPFFEGRYLDFNQAEFIKTEALQYFLIEGMTIENLPSDLNLKLDGLTGQLVDASGQQVDDNYNPFPEKPTTPSIIAFSQQLGLRGVSASTIFSEKSTKVSLLRVVPLRNIANDPFNDRTLPILIAKARQPSVAPSIITPSGGGGAPPPPPGACPLNTALNFVGALPDGMPLGQTITISAVAPYQLGLGLVNAVINIGVVNPGNAIEGVVSLAPGYSYISGSALGTVTEGANLLYLVRRNSDSVEFEISFRFSVELVLDDMGIVIQTLSARLCQAGGAA